MSSLVKRILYFKVFKAEINYRKLNPRHWKRPSFKKIVRGLGYLVIFLGALIIVKDEASYQFGWGYYSSDYDSYYEEDYSETEEGGGECNIYGIELRGSLVTYVSADSLAADGSLLHEETASEYIVSLIRRAEDEETVKAILLEIDSYGGYPVAAEEVANALKQAKKPTVALVRGAATSAAYWSATGADIIFASPMSDVGGIGVTMSYLDNSQKNAREGLTYNSLSVGRFKDYGDPDKPLTQEERRLIMRDLEITQDFFIKTVSENRGLPIEQVESLADGSSMPGQMALENGLIDRLGGDREVQEYLKEKLGEEIDVCW